MSNNSTYVYVSDSEKTWTAVHGALMALAWCLLLPMGVIFARHRDALFHGKMVSIFGWQPKALWFYLHLSLQLGGIAAFVSGWIIALSALPGAGPAGTVGSAHVALGVTTFVLAMVQIVVGLFLRPAPDAPLRKYWNWFHWWVGRITMLTAWSALFTGIYTNHHPKGQYGSIKSHSAILAAVIGVFLIWDVIMTCLGRTAKKITPNPSMSGSDAQVAFGVAAPGDVEGGKKVENVEMANQSRWWKW